MINVVLFLVGFATGLVLAGFFEQRAVREILSLRTYLRAELQRLATRL